MPRGGKRDNQTGRPRRDPSGPTVPVTARAPEALVAAARAAAEARGISLSEWVAEAIAAHLAR